MNKDTALKKLNDIANDWDSEGICGPEAEDLIMYIEETSTDAELLFEENKELKDTLKNREKINEQLLQKNNELMKRIEKEIEYIKKEYEDMPELYEQEGSIKDQLKILEGDK